jgi:MtN3 and saliva related transmembrane protein
MARLSVSPARRMRAIAKVRSSTMNPVTLGLVAGAFTSFASLPQIIRIIQRRSMNDISLVTLCMFALGVSLWLGYGIEIHAAPVILWNAMSLTLYITQIMLKLSFSGQFASLFAGLDRRATSGTMRPDPVLP